MRKLIAATLASCAVVARAEEKVATERELVDDDGYTVRLSLPTEADDEAWRAPGLQVALGIGGGRLWGSGPAPDLTPTAFSLRALARIDPRWSLGVDLDYAAASTPELNGIRFAGLLQAMLHPWRGLGVGLGLGYGGLTLTPKGGGPFPTEAATVSRTVGPGEKLRDCDGDAGVGRLRAEYLFVVGSLFATGPYLQADAQLTRCESIIDGLDTDTGKPVVLRQWWLERGVVAGWWFAWR